VRLAKVPKHLSQHGKKHHRTLLFRRLVQASSFADELRNQGQQETALFQQTCEVETMQCWWVGGFSVSEADWTKQLYCPTMKRTQSTSHQEAPHQTGDFPLLPRTSDTSMNLAQTVQRNAEDAFLACLKTVIVYLKLVPPLETGLVTVWQPNRTSRRSDRIEGLTALSRARHELKETIVAWNKMYQELQQK